MFNQNNDGNFHYLPITNPEKLTQTLPAGIYDTLLDDKERLYFIPKQLNTDVLVDVNTEAWRMVRREVQSFFDVDVVQAFALASIRHCRGILLHGPAGTGKTSLVRAQLNQMLANNAVVLLDPYVPDLMSDIIPAIRLTDSTRPIVILLDEFDSVARSYARDIQILMDGLTSPNRIMVIGTTNFIDMVPKTMCARPGRFSLVLEINQLPQNILIAYVLGKFPTISADIAAQIVKICAELPIDYVEEGCKLFLGSYTLAEIAARFKLIDVNEARKVARKRNQEFED